MEGAANVLVIILTVVVIIFLLLGIALAVILIKISKQIKHIADKAEVDIGKVGLLTFGPKKFTLALAAAKMGIGLLKKRRKGAKHGKGE